MVRGQWMRWGPQEKGCEAGPSAKGEERQGCEDGDGMESLKRVGNSIQSMGHWEGGGVEGRAVGRGRDHPPPQMRRASTYTLQHFTALSLTSHSTSTWCLLATVLATGDTKPGRVPHGPVGSHSKALPPSSSEGRAQIEVQSVSVTGWKAHSQEVAAFRSAPGLLTPNPTLATRLSLRCVAFRPGHPVPLSKDGTSRRYRGRALDVPSPVVDAGSREGGMNPKPSPRFCS